MYRKVNTTFKDGQGKPYFVCFEFTVDDGAVIWYELGDETAETVPLDLILSTRKILASLQDEPMINMLCR